MTDKDKTTPKASKFNFKPADYYDHLIARRGRGPSSDYADIYEAARSLSEDQSWDTQDLGLAFEWRQARVMRAHLKTISQDRYPAGDREIVLLQHTDPLEDDKHLIAPPSNKRQTDKRRFYYVLVNKPVTPEEQETRKKQGKPKDKASAHKAPATVSSDKAPAEAEA